MKDTLKFIFRPAYTTFRYLIYRYCKHHFYTPFALDERFTMRKVSARKESFYGYYNLSPENSDGDIIYCAPNKNHKSVDICVNKSGKETVIANTSSFNWQQGAMQQWGRTDDRKIYYNNYDAKNDKYEAIVVDTKNKDALVHLPLPLYSLSPREDFYLTLNFERLALMRPDYGYFCRKSINIPDDSKDGIWRVNINNHEVQLILTLEQLKHFSPVQSMRNASHKVNHIDISPDGSRFMFLHRWVGPEGRFMRLFTAACDGSDLYLLNGDIMTSHCYWVDNNRIVSYCHTSDFGNAYVLFEDKKSLIKKLIGELPNEDGHPSTKGGMLITDTYPGFDRMSRLWLYRFDNCETINLGRFYQPLKYSGTKRIDLHPKWGCKNNVFFESGHDGFRNLYEIKLK